MRKLLRLVPLLFLVLGFPGTKAFAQGYLPTHPFSFEQNFETDDPFLTWASKGSHTVNYKGLSRDRASSGQSSFKLDVTFEEGGYAYWRIPVGVPAAGELSLSGDLWIAEAEGVQVSLGTNLSLFPAPFTGVSTLERLGSPSDQWITQRSDLVAGSEASVAKFISRRLGGCTTTDVGIWTGQAGLFLYTKEGGHITVYVDNLQISGVVPESAAYRSYAEEAWQGYLSRIAKTVADKASLITEYPDQGIDPGYEPLLRDSKTRAAEILTQANERKYPTVEELAELNLLVATVESAGEQERSLVENQVHSFVIYPWNPTTSQKILPETYPMPAKLGSSVSIQACQEEFEPASFVIRALEPLTEVRITATDLIGPHKKVIPSSAIDIRLVKNWYQAGWQVWDVSHKMLAPELLLKDDQLIKVDLSSQRNYVRVMLGQKSEYIEISTPGAKIPEGAVLVDSKALLPFDLDAGMNKQVWITLQVPQKTTPGQYVGAVTVTAGGVEKKVDLQLEVLPFDLAPPMLEYSVYYRGKLTEDPIEGLGSEWKTPEQYRLELEDMRDHGIWYPNLYQHYNEFASEALLRRSLEIRKEVGLPTDKLYVLGQCTGRSTSPRVLAMLAERVRTWIALASSYGYGQLFFYGIDEARGDLLTAQRMAWGTVKANGGKVFVACHAGDFALVGDILDVAVLSGAFKKQDALEWHKQGKKVFLYSFPQVGLEDPGLYRRHYGFFLLQNEYDGAMDYAYQHGFGDIWNDFDSTYRDHVFTYPVSDGVIDTVQFEGFREAVDDIRYLSTLAQQRKWSREETVLWLQEQMEDDSDPATLRARIIEAIINKKSCRNLWGIIP